MIYLEPCGHYFCTECHSRAAIKSNQCPLCCSAITTQYSLVVLQIYKPFPSKTLLERSGPLQFIERDNKLSLIKEDIFGSESKRQIFYQTQGKFFTPPLPIGESYLIRSPSLSNEQVLFLYWLRVKLGAVLSRSRFKVHNKNSSRVACLRSLALLTAQESDHSKKLGLSWEILGSHLVFWYQSKKEPLATKDLVETSLVEAELRKSYHYITDKFPHTAFITENTPKFHLEIWNIYTQSPGANGQNFFCTRRCLGCLHRKKDMHCDHYCTRCHAAIHVSTLKTTSMIGDPKWAVGNNPPDDRCYICMPKKA